MSTRWQALEGRVHSDLSAFALRVMVNDARNHVTFNQCVTMTKMLHLTKTERHDRVSVSAVK